MFNQLFSLLAEEAPRGGIAWWVWLILIIILLVILWYWFGREDEEVAIVEEPIKAEALEAQAAPEIVAVVEKPKKADEPDAEPVVEVVPDDLKKIEGIGPKVSSLLKAAGIATFAQLADAELEKLQEILETNKLQYMNPSTWAEQAKIAASGDWDALAKLQEELSGGKR